MRALTKDAIVVKGRLPSPPIGGAAVRRRLHTPWAVWGKLPMAITAGVSGDITGWTITPVSPVGRTPVVPPLPLTILGEPLPTTYVVDSIIVIVTKRRASKSCTRIQGTVVTLGEEAASSHPPPSSGADGSLGQSRDPSLLGGEGEGLGGPEGATKTDTGVVSLPWCS